MSQGPLVKEGKLVFREEGLPTSGNSRGDSRIPPKPSPKAEKVRTLVLRGEPCVQFLCRGLGRNQGEFCWPDSYAMKGKAEALLTCSPATVLPLGGGS